MWQLALFLQLAVGGGTPPVCEPGDTLTCSVSGCIRAWKTCNALGNWGACACQCWPSTNPCEVASWNGTSCVKAPSPATTFCNDGNACTHSDHCSGTTTACVGTAISCASDTCATRTCNGTPTCSVSYTAAGTPCSDGNLCTYGDACSSGACAGTTVTCPKALSGSCVAGYSCNGTATCTVQYKPVQSPCKDSDACNGVDACNASGQCITGPVPVIDDGKACTTDSCDRATGIVSHVPLGPEFTCSDGNICNGLETCLAGACTAGPAPLIDDGKPCTVDSCDPLSGLILHMSRTHELCWGSVCACDEAGDCRATQPFSEFNYDAVGNVASRTTLVAGAVCQ